MRRRDFLKALTLAALSSGVSTRVLGEIIRVSTQLASIPDASFDNDYFEKMRNFYRPHPGDVYLDKAQYAVFESTLRRIRKLEDYVGHGFFNLLDADTAFFYGRNHAEVGPFTKAELDFLEMLFYEDARRYGFLGEKPLKKITDQIPKQEVIKVPYTGNYLYRGRPLETYDRMRAQVGGNLILTSGVRGVMKQFRLFLERAHENDGNLSLASRSLAPPGFSFHGISDFDVGQVGLGSDNFTERFVTTDLCRKLQQLGYLTLRYDRDNLLGVRFEPWHVKVA